VERQVCIECLGVNDLISFSADDVMDYAKRCRKDLAPLLSCPTPLPTPTRKAKGSGSREKEEGLEEGIAVKASNKKIFHVATAVSES